MTQDVGYWYNGQIRNILLHTQRLFSNFYISNGLKEDGTEDLVRVPCIFMSTDKSAVNLINNNTDTVIESAPKMVLTISELKLNNNLISGAAYYELSTDITEKHFNEEKGEYEYEYGPGNSYGIHRLNPLPIGLTFRLYILTTMQTHKFQLFEQIRMLFSPTLELQTSENPLDWTRITALTLTGCNYSSRGTNSLDSTQLDAMDLTFELNTNLDAPALMTKSNLVENIVTEIGQGNHVEDIFGWGEGDSFRTFHTPMKNFITIQNNNEIILQPNDEIKNWNQLFKKYGFKYDKKRENINVHCLATTENSKPLCLYGSIIIDPNDSTKAQWHMAEELLPQVDEDYCIDAIIDPHDCEQPLNRDGERYLLDDEIGSGTMIWGQFKNKKGENIDRVPENCIIEYRNGFWTLILDPQEEPGEYYITDKDGVFLYSYSSDYNIWYDVVNRKYRAGNWRISSL